MNRILPALTCTILAAISATGAVHANDNDAKKEADNLAESIQSRVTSLRINAKYKFQTNYSFSTYNGMYAYRELLLWARNLPEDSSLRNEILTIVHIGLRSIVRDSGMGLPLKGGQSDGQPSGMLFADAMPQYVEIPDFSKVGTLKWDPQQISRKSHPESVGQSLAAKSLFVMTDTSPNGKQLSNLLLTSAVQEYQTLTNLMELGGAKPATYMPAAVELAEGNWKTVIDISHIYGQMSLLSGLTQLYSLLSNANLEPETINGKSPAVWRNDVYQTITQLYQRTVEHHFDSKLGTFVSTFDPLKGTRERLTTDDAGYILEVLTDLINALPDDDPLRGMAMQHLTAQADFLHSKLDTTKLAPAAFLTKKNLVSSGFLFPLADQISVVAGLLAAGKATGNSRYNDAALSLFEKVKEDYWSAKAGVFRATRGATASGYDGRLLGLALSTWRHLDAKLPDGDAEKQVRQLINAVVLEAGLLEAEIPENGEPKQPEDFFKHDLPKLINEIIDLDETKREERIAAAIKALSDQNGNSVPGYRFAGGKFGSAPVFLGQTSIKTPFPPPETSKTDIAEKEK